MSARPDMHVCPITFLIIFINQQFSIFSFSSQGLRPAAPAWHLDAPSGLEGLPCGQVNEPKRPTGRFWGITTAGRGEVGSGSN